MHPELVPLNLASTHLFGATLQAEAARSAVSAIISGMRLGDIVNHKRKEIRELARFHGADNLRIFGSVARNVPDAADVDFLVEMEPGRSLLDLVGLQQDLEDLLGCKVDVISERGMSPYLRDRILAEARPL